VLGSLLAGVCTAWVGAYVGSRFRDTPCEDCGVEGGIYGAALAAIEMEQWEVLLAVPVAQIASAVAIHRRARRE
jgi:hypothetical protein